MPRAIEFPHDFRLSRRWASYARAAVRARGVNLSLRMLWRQRANFAKASAVSLVLRKCPMSPDALNSFFSLCIGFALAGALASGYQALVHRPAGFGLLQEGVAPKTFAAGAVLGVSAAFIIIRHTLRGGKIGPPRAQFVLLGTRPGGARGR